MLSRDRLIVALDVPSAPQARQVVQSIGEAATTYKVGKQLFTAEGPQIVRDLVASGRKVFLDLKFHDIPNTVAGAVRAAAELGVSMLTVHASGGGAMLKAAAQAAAQSPKKPMVLAVTVLTSLSDADLMQLGIASKVIDHVVRLAALARDAGCGGVVASALEAHELRRELGSDFAIVTPGIRPGGLDLHGGPDLQVGPHLPSVGKCGDQASRDDQARVLTPKEAIAAGANYLVVGRPILEAADPSRAANEIVREIEEAELAAATVRP
jgi:orotidine-5'-phosphate decarboxylase